MHKSLTRHQPAIADICKRHGVVRLDVFGSIARESDFDPEHSDVDFEDGYGVDAYFGLKGDLERLLGRSVDIVTKTALDYSPHGRLDDQIAKEARLVYGQ